VRASLPDVLAPAEPRFSAHLGGVDSAGLADVDPSRPAYALVLKIPDQRGDKASQHDYADDRRHRDLRVLTGEVAHPVSNSS